MNDKKTVSFGMALAIIFLPILVILLGGLVLRVGFLVPLMLATITASLLSIMAGFTWKEVEACIVNGVHRIIIVTCILFLVGTLIGVWIQAGVIPLFLYWGLKLLSPSMFLVSTVLICAVFSLMTGTSFGTIGTAGLALLGVGEALGFPTGLTAGAIVSGAYFGDKMSPGFRHHQPRLGHHRDQHFLPHRLHALHHRARHPRGPRPLLVPRAQLQRRGHARPDSDHRRPLSQLQPLVPPRPAAHRAGGPRHPGHPAAAHARHRHPRRRGLRLRHSGRHDRKGACSRPPPTATFPRPGTHSWTRSSPEAA